MPSKHLRSIPMRRMSSNWAHRHRPPASHAPTSGASVADVLPKGRLPRGDTSAHRTQSAVPPWQMFCRKEDYHERHLRSPHPVCRAPVADVLPEGKVTTRKHLRSPHPVCGASVADVLPKGRLPREGTSGSVSGRETSRQGLSGWESATGSHARRRRHALHRKGAEDSNMITERDYENILHFACEHGPKQEL